MNLWKYMESFYGNIFIQGLADFYDLRDNQQKKKIIFPSSHFLLVKWR